MSDETVRFDVGADAVYKGSDPWGLDWIPVSSFDVAAGDEVRAPNLCSLTFSLTAPWIEGRVVSVSDDRRSIVLAQGEGFITVDGTCDTRWFKRGDHG